MNILEDVLEICYRFVVICSVMSMSTLALCAVLFVWGWLKALPKNKKKISVKPQVLGKVSTVSMRSARLALLERTTTKTSVKPVKKPRRLATTPPKIPFNTLQCHPVSKPSPISAPALPKELQPSSLQHFFVDGATTFRIIPGLQKSDDATEQLRRISREFMPIIRKRGFHIRSISEMCCCSNGLEYELGGNRRCVKAGEDIGGNEANTVAGYNGKLLDRHGRTEHVIHLRLRKPENHGAFLPVEEIVDTMVHELAHCVYEDHGPQFWALMEDIATERAAVLERLKKSQTTKGSPDPVATSKEMFEGFNIYASFSSRVRRNGKHGSR